MEFQELKKYAIIVAAGSGTRMESQTPKQFLVLHQKPLLMHTMLAFANVSEAIEIILVLPSDQIPVWKDLCRNYGFSIPHVVHPGGDSRFQSVKSGLECIDGMEGVVAVHDGVRPLVSRRMITESYQLATLKGSAVAAVALKESIREVWDPAQSQSRDRSAFRIIQTPQTFQVKLLKKSYMQMESEELTDDASVMEKAGYEIRLFEGEYSNIKITTPEDLLIAKAIWPV